jgi:hypothetical protein
MKQTKRHVKSATPDWVKTCWSQIASHAVIFRTDQQYCEVNASLHLRDPGYGYAKGFHIGGQILADHLFKSGHDMDVLVFPIVFLYRHHIELMLKRMIVKGASFAKKTLSANETGVLTEHRLDSLWNTLRPILKTAIPSLPARALKGIDSYIKQLSHVDPTGESFRYDMSKKGKGHLAQLRHINVHIFAEAMEWLTCNLEGVDCMLDEKIEVLDQKASEAHN